MVKNKEAAVCKYIEQNRRDTAINFVTDEYLKIRLEELKWAVAFMELKNKEKEEQRAIKEQMR